VPVGWWELTGKAGPPPQVGFGGRGRQLASWLSAGDWRTVKIEIILLVLFLQNRTWNSGLPCLPIPSAEITGVPHHTQLSNSFLAMYRGRG
jgi:hypothetical protein